MCLRVQFSGALFFFKCVNDLSRNLEANVKLFADDTSTFSVVSNPINTSQELNKDLGKVGLLPINEKWPSIQIHQNKLKR